jgi:hypothetical protein
MAPLVDAIAPLQASRNIPNKTSYFPEFGSAA